TIFTPDDFPRLIKDENIDIDIKENKKEDVFDKELKLEILENNNNIQIEKDITNKNNDDKHPTPNVNISIN
ncbi:hypothetical protein CU098_007562, partial [Rhizopus stolonifer]